MTDRSTFPDPTYRDTVLAPLFEGVKRHYAHGMAAINRAHLVMLDETGILPLDDASQIARALRAARLNRFKMDVAVDNSQEGDQEIIQMIGMLLLIKAIKLAVIPKVTKIQSNVLLGTRLNLHGLKQMKTALVKKMEIKIERNRVIVN